MGKINRLVRRLIDRSHAITPHKAMRRIPDEPVKCIDGKLYRMRLRAGRWESFGPPLADCEEDE